MTSPTIGPLLQAADEHPVAVGYLAGMAVMLAVLTAIALSRLRRFESVVDEFAVENQLDRRSLLGGVVVTWPTGWPITLAVLTLRMAWRIAWRRR